ncbi:MAG: uridine kinase [Acidimicrobiia bacterium]
MERWPTGDSMLIIGIAGGSGSGKTTVASALVDGLDSSGVAIIQHDSYYRDHPDLSHDQRAALNFDHPDAFETELLVEHLQALRKNDHIDKPQYNFATHRRLPETVSVEPCKVVVVEGILVLVEPELRDMFDLRIFVDTDADIRFIRRLQRDVKDRGRSVESVTTQYLETVRPMHLRFVEGSKRYADLIMPEGYSEPGVGTVISMVRSHLDT